MAYSIGVISLSRNQGVYLLEAINSILVEKPAKYIVYDCGSTDESRQIIDSKETSILQKIFVDSDSGPADGLNRAFQQLEEDIFYYLNADDRLIPGAFSFVSQYFSENPECDVLHGSINIIDASGFLVRVLPSMNFSLRGFALGYSVVYQQATFIRTRVLHEIKFNVDNRISWDGELIVDLAINGACIHRTEKVLADFRIYPDSITGSGKFRSLAKMQHKKIARKILGRPPRLYEVIFGFTFRIIKSLGRRIRPRIDYLS
jgi:glycosyltransferase involved in cell wall biosynthesis